MRDSLACLTQDVLWKSSWVFIRIYYLLLLIVCSHSPLRYVMTYLVPSAVQWVHLWQISEDKSEWRTILQLCSWNTRLIRMYWRSFLKEGQLFFMFIVRLFLGLHHRLCIAVSNLQSIAFYILKQMSMYQNNGLCCFSSKFSTLQHFCFGINNKFNYHAVHLLIPSLIFLIKISNYWTFSTWLGCITQTSILTHEYFSIIIKLQTFGSFALVPFLCRYHSCWVHEGRVAVSCLEATLHKFLPSFSSYIHPGTSPLMIPGPS